MQHSTAPNAPAASGRSAGGTPARVPALLDVVALQIALDRGAKDATTVNLARRSGTGDGIWGHATSSDEKTAQKGHTAVEVDEGGCGHRRDDNQRGEPRVARRQGDDRADLRGAEPLNLST